MENANYSVVKAYSSPSWISEALGPVPKVIADVLVFVHGLRGLRYKAGASGRKQGIWKSRTGMILRDFFTYSPIHTNATRSDSDRE